MDDIYVEFHFVGCRYSKRVDATEDLNKAIEVDFQSRVLPQIITCTFHEDFANSALFFFSSLQTGNAEDIEKFSKRTVKVSFSN